MKQTSDPLYFIAILPPPLIRDEIRTIKESIRDRHGVKHALKLMSHITLQIPFRISAAQEKILVRELREFAATKVPFQVDLDGFGNFSKHVIFIKVRDHALLLSLHSELQGLLRSFIEFRSQEIATKMHPHLSIAVRDLKRSNFPSVWKDFENREFKRSFQATGLVLFRHNSKTWDLHKSFEFGDHSLEH